MQKEKHEEKLSYADSFLINMNHIPTRHIRNIYSSLNIHGDIYLIFNINFYNYSHFTKSFALKNKQIQIS